MSAGAIVIIGAGQAGGWAAKTLRTEGYAGPIVLFGDEQHPPHERPPLSKTVLSGSADATDCALFKSDAFAALDLDFRPGARVTKIDREAHAVVTASNEPAKYDRLILTMGSRVRRLGVTGAELPGVQYLRTIDDATALRERLREGAHLLVIGGGWIGLEVAATARKRGVSVTVVEAASRLCARAAPAELSDFLANLHRAHGIDLRLGTGLLRFEATANGGIMATLGDGTCVKADTVVVGIGIVPNDELARDAGLSVDNGIVVDERCCTSDPDIFAAGDVTNQPTARLRRRTRLKSWQNAQDQAMVAAKSAIGVEARYDPLPWFWSDQYDANIQILGLPREWPGAIVRGDATQKAFSLFYLEDEVIKAVVAVNAARDLRAARRLIEQAKPVRSEQIRDAASSLQKL